MPGLILGIQSKITLLASLCLVPVVGLSRFRSGYMPADAARHADQASHQGLDVITRTTAPIQVLVPGQCRPGAAGGGCAGAHR